MSADDRLPIISVHPEPTPEELAAIVAAVTAALKTRRAAELVSAPLPAVTSRWARQGRLDAMHGRDREGEYEPR